MLTRKIKKPNMKHKIYRILLLVWILLCLASLIKIFVDMKSDDIKDIAGEYQVVAVEDVKDDDDYVGTWWHLHIDSKDKYFSIYDNEAGNPGVEGEIDFIDGSSLIVKIDPDYYEELPCGRWKSDGETLEVKYMKTDSGIDLENNGKTISFTKEEE